MSGKWQRFYDAQNNLDISQANTDNSATVADWSRELRSAQRSKNDTVHINGQALSRWGEEYNNFNNNEDVKKFFKEVILKNLPDENKDENAEYLMKRFHQGGFLYPVSSAFSMSMKNLGLTVNDSERKQVINIESTPSGFKVQQFTEVQSLLNPNSKNSDPRITSDKNLDYVARLQGTIALEFSKSTGEPKVRIESNTISYGHSRLEKYLDNRSLGQRIVDFFKKVLKINDVKDISKAAESPERDQNHDHEEMQSFRPRK